MTATEGQRVVVTGAARGIGRALVAAFAADGAAVAGIDIREDVVELAEDGSAVHGIVADLTRSHEVIRSMAAATELLGGVDILVNVAGGMQESDLVWRERDALSVSEAEFDWAFALNVKSALLAAQAVAPSMIRGGGGAIIMFGSGFGERTAAGRMPYTVAKAAISGLTRSLATEWGRHGIRVNEVVPYATTDATRDRAADPDTGARMRGRIPLGRLAEPDEIAPAVLFLASDAARYITGARLHVDGGRCVVV